MKIFSCSPSYYNKFTFKLSKHFGFVQFFPFNLLIYWTYTNVVVFKPQDYIYQLIGFKNTKITSGYKQPGFKDYFHYQPGDILIWEYNYDSDGCCPYVHYSDHKYYFDSITSMNLTDTGVYYCYFRKIYQNQHFYLSSYGDCFKIKFSEEGKFLTYPTNWDEENGYYTRSITLNINGKDTVSQYGYGLNYAADGGWGYRFSTGKGLIYNYHSNSGGGSTEELIGSIINGKSEGTILKFQSIENTGVNSISFFPNPTKGVIFINADNPELKYKINICDMMGRKVYEEPNFSGTSLDISNLANGIYFISITATDTNYSGKIILSK